MTVGHEDQPRLPMAVLSTGLMLLAFLSIAIGLMLDTITRGRRETQLLVASRRKQSAGGEGHDRDCAHQ